MDSYSTATDCYRDARRSCQAATKVCLDYPPSNQRYRTRIDGGTRSTWFSFTASTVLTLIYLGGVSEGFLPVSPSGRGPVLPRQCVLSHPASIRHNWTGGVVAHTPHKRTSGSAWSLHLCGSWGHLPLRKMPGGTSTLRMQVPDSPQGEVPGSSFRSNVGVGGYGLEDTPSTIVQIELQEVPIERAVEYLHEWGEKRVTASSSDSRDGVPKTNMPVTTTKLADGITLSFDASPTDIIELDTRQLSGGGSSIVVTRGAGGLVRGGGMGPQVASLVRHTEDVIKSKLEEDMNTFATNYHHRIVTGVVPPPTSAGGAGKGLNEGSAGGGVTVLEDGVIDVTPPVEVDVSPRPGGEGRQERRDRPPVPSVMELFKQESEGFDVGGLGFKEAIGEGEKSLDTVFEKMEPEEMSRFKDEAVDLFMTMEQGQDEETKKLLKTGFRGVISDLQEGDSSNSEVKDMFQAGKEAAMRGEEDQTAIPAEKDLFQLEVMIGGDTGLRGGWDIFAGPGEPITGTMGEQEELAAHAEAEMQRSVDGNGTASAVGAAGEEATSQTYTMFDEDGDPVLQLTAEEINSLDENELTMAMATVDVLLSELQSAPNDLWVSICHEYKDVYLNPYYILAMRARIPKASIEERRAMSAANQMAVACVQELAVEYQRREMQQLEKIKAICTTAIEGMEGLPDKVRSMKPLLDQNFVSYLGYAIDVERKAMRKEFRDPDRDPTRWLQVLGVIRKGVLAELEKDVYEDVQAIAHILQLQEPEARLQLLKITIDTLPSMSARGFQRVATNIVNYFDGNERANPELAAKIAELGVNLKELLTPERVNELSKDADDWAAEQAKAATIESMERKVRQLEKEERDMQRYNDAHMVMDSTNPQRRKPFVPKRDDGNTELADTYEDRQDEEEERAIIEQLRLSLQQEDEEQNGTSPVEVISEGGRKIWDEDSEEGDEGIRRQLQKLTGPGGSLEKGTERAKGRGWGSGEDQPMKDAGVEDNVVSFLNRVSEGNGETYSPKGFTASKQTKSLHGRKVGSLTGGRGKAVGKKMKRGIEEAEEEEGDDEEWGSFDVEDWGGEEREEGGEVENSRNGVEGGVSGARKGEEVPGMLDGLRFKSVFDVEGEAAKES